MDPPRPSLPVPLSMPLMTHAVWSQEPLALAQLGSALAPASARIGERRGLILLIVRDQFIQQQVKVGLRVGVVTID